jgi:SET domain-containing protein
MRIKNKSKRPPPHIGVYTRLGRSKIHGVGVFAIQKIKKGTHLFTGDDAKLVWVKGEEIKKLPTEIRQLYRDFAIVKDGRYGCPINFNQLTVAWYLNSPKGRVKPNVRCDDNYQFFALRDINPAEELTVDYDAYSDDPDLDMKAD